MFPLSLSLSLTSSSTRSVKMTHTPHWSEVKRKSQSSRETNSLSASQAGQGRFQWQRLMEVDLASQVPKVKFLRETTDNIKNASYFVVFEGSSGKTTDILRYYIHLITDFFFPTFFLTFFPLCFGFFCLSSSCFSPFTNKLPCCQ